MLVEFSVSNFRSIGDRQTLSMAAASRRNRKQSPSIETHPTLSPHLLRAAAIYGPNASGKSNLVKALSFMRFFTLNSAKGSQEGEKIPVTPFRLSKRTRSLQSEFEIVFLNDETRYQYGFALNENRVLEEWLFVVPKGGRTQQWIDRRYEKSNNTYHWHINPRLKGERVTWQKSTRSNALLLSTAVLLNAEPLKPVYNWFQNIFKVLDSDRGIIHNYTSKICRDDETMKKVLSFMKSADIDVKSIVVEEREFSDQLRRAELSDELAKELARRLEGKKYYSVLFGHSDGEGETHYFELEDESDGTQALFLLAGPWQDVLRHGLILVVDELHNSLHPILLRYIVELIANPKTNPNNAQLVFTTHDTSLMSSHLLRRDQIWFIEKDKNQESNLLPLSDFKISTKMAMEKGYLGGRFGALPYINQMELNFFDVDS